VKIFIDCESPLLARSLADFLAEKSCSFDECDFVISDRNLESSKPVFIIGKNSVNLKMPFTKDELNSALMSYFSALNETAPEQMPKPADLETQISNLIDEFKANLLKIIKENRE